MPSFEFQKTSIEGLTLIMPKFFPDARGYLEKTFEREAFDNNGIQFAPVKELQTRSEKGTVRGLHFQHEHSQDKLVRVLSGEVYDVAVDLRKDSISFGQWEGFYLSGENRRMLYIPKGFAHGFLAVSSEAVLHYLCGDRYDPESEDGIIWNDPDLEITWPVKSGMKPRLSQRDGQFQSFSEFRRKYRSFCQE